MQQPYPLFRLQGELDGVEWLRANPRRAEVVLGAYESGYYVVAHSGNRVVLGHWAETVDWQTKYNQVEQFFRATTEDTFRRDLLKHYRGRYNWEGAREREIGGFDPSRLNYVEPIYTNSDVVIY